MKCQIKTTNYHTHIITLPATLKQVLTSAGLCIMVLLLFYIVELLKYIWGPTV